MGDFTHFRSARRRTRSEIRWRHPVRDHPARPQHRADTAISRRGAGRENAPADPPAVFPGPARGQPQRLPLSRRTECCSACRLDADRRGKVLTCFDFKGSKDGSDSISMMVASDSNDEADSRHIQIGTSQKSGAGRPPDCRSGGRSPASGVHKPLTSSRPRQTQRTMLNNTPVLRGQFRPTLRPAPRRLWLLSVPGSGNRVSRQARPRLPRRSGGLRGYPDKGGRGNAT